MATKQPDFSSRLESQALRENLKLRKNPHIGAWEVWSRVAGQGYFKWITISDESKRWYVENFNTPIVDFAEA